MTEWKAFRSPDPDKVQELLTEPLIFNGRNLYDPASVAAAGIEYHAIGGPVVKKRERHCRVIESGES